MEDGIRGADGDTTAAVPSPIMIWEQAAPFYSHEYQANDAQCPPADSKRQPQPDQRAAPVVRAPVDHQFEPRPLGLAGSRFSGFAFSMAIEVNRTPVLTLWAAGWDWS